MKSLKIEGKLHVIPSTEDVIILAKDGDKTLAVFANEAEVQKIHDWTSEWLAERAAQAPKTIPVVAGENWEDDPKPYATGALFTPPFPAEYINLKIEEDK